MPYLPFDHVVDQMDHKSQLGEPFCFFIDYAQKASFLGSQEDALQQGIFFDFSGNHAPLQKAISFQKYPLSLESYQEKFRRVQEGLRAGNSFLCNLTQETRIETNLSLEEIYQSANAKYKLLVKDAFVVFSPETFVQIKDGIIYSYPMKGTQKDLDGDSRAKLLQNEKENAEHATIVDLIRNDISKVAYPIKVEKYKFVEKVKTHEGDLWQMSSKISGELQTAFKGKIGSILQELLPAGSITGAPKAATCSLIQAIEGYERGFYTGIMGIFDGEMLDTAVMIRYIEKRNEQYYFKSGGGITVFSQAEKEYQELCDKIYLPF